MGEYMTQLYFNLAICLVEQKLNEFFS